MLRSCFVLLSLLGAAAALAGRAPARLRAAKAGPGALRMSMATQPVWFQRRISVTPPGRGSHLITRQIEEALGADLREVSVGLLHVFIQHTSASLQINEVRAAQRPAGQPHERALA